ncbi:hypothetical protein VIBNISO65_430006 [Vibrio nigripulchritudo SO65]|nr:hypothetical protein VIBNIAM115_1680006 [Vibrio nigripulchritudo AM115]CCN39644.1 hypothetical protein VIBNIFTn2_1100006 [Vibrio nigripulchritudo FTn2]CCN63271.1 hypothetical protein VIBNIPon4_120006 [Vibrio nigripulchritudo POn4]CCN77893.1 hypothetical protein VIBNISO65_430006 [Vibrio nigripulchritudo SO65]
MRAFFNSIKLNKKKTDISNNQKRITNLEYFDGLGVAKKLCEK